MEKSVTLDPPGTEKRCKLKERACAGSSRARRDEGDSQVWSDELVTLGWEGNRSLEERTAVSEVRSEGREMIRCGVSKIIRLRSRMDPR